MYSRLRDGLLSPASVIDYIKDKWGRTILQLLLYALLLSVPTIISVLTYDGLSYDQKLEIRQVFNDETIPFEIVDGKLTSLDKNDNVYKKKVSDLIYVRISLVPNEDIHISEAYLISFEEEKVVLSMAGIKTDVLNYNEYNGLRNFDFSKLGDYSNVTEWDVIFNAIRNVAKRYLPYATGILTFSAIMQNALFLIVFALIISLTFRMRFASLLKYNAMLKLGIYYLAPYVICTLISSLMGFGLLYYLGMILSIVYSIIGSNTIITKLMGQGRK